MFYTYDLCVILIYLYIFYIFLCTEERIFYNLIMKIVIYIIRLNNHISLIFFYVIIIMYCYFLCIISIRFVFYQLFICKNIYQFNI